MSTMVEEKYDVVIVGGSFSGLTLAHHLPKNYKVLILERKPRADTAVESTGLITTVTKELLEKFINVDKFLPNKIATIGVISPNYDDYFFSSTNKPWIYSTDTPNLVKEMAVSLPNNCRIEYSSAFCNYFLDDNSDCPVVVECSNQGKNKLIRSKFIVGADGARSKVAGCNKNLSINKKFLIGFEKVYYGKINFGPHPESTIYHFWFGEFSLGYGGWISPTIINGQEAFRVGLAKLETDMKDLKKLDYFVEILKEKNIISIYDPKSILTFCSHIAIGGPLKNVSDKNCLLIGEAAGLCGAFAADGIKGAIVSGQAAAKLIPQYLSGDKIVLKNFFKEIQKFNKLMTYYYKQLLYRFIWDRMKKDRTFVAMYKIIANNKEHFLSQFCDSKDKNKSLVRLVLRWRELPKLAYYGVCLIMDSLF